MRIDIPVRVDLADALDLVHAAAWRETWLALQSASSLEDFYGKVQGISIAAAEAEERVAD